MNWTPQDVKEIVGLIVIGVAVVAFFWAITRD